MPNIHTANRHRLSVERHARQTAAAIAAVGKVIDPRPILAASKARAAVRAARKRHTAKA